MPSGSTSVSASVFVTSRSSSSNAGSTSAMRRSSAGQSSSGRRSPSDLSAADRGRRPAGIWTRWSAGSADGACISGVPSTMRERCLVRRSSVVGMPEPRPHSCRSWCAIRPLDPKRSLQMALDPMSRLSTPWTCRRSILPVGCVRTTGSKTPICRSASRSATYSSLRTP